MNGDRNNIIQNKTGAELYISSTHRLSKFLASAPKRGFFIANTAHGTATHNNTAEQRFRRIRNAIGRQGYVMHGWRYTATHQLAQAGSTDGQIASITDHKSLQILAKCSRNVGQRKLSKNGNE
ncbi:site-specific integrase [Yoonia sp. MH D7]